MPRIARQTFAMLHLLFVQAVTFGVGASVDAAELRLRAQCTSSGAVVTVGDVAEIATNDPREAARLAAIELFPAPAAQRPRFLRIRELQDLLFLHGNIDLTSHRLTGSNQVEISSVPVKSEPDTPLASSVTKKAQRRVQEALLQYLKQQSPQVQEWTVEFELSASQAKAVTNSTAAIAASGGISPWTGSQQFEIAVDAAGKPQRLTVAAEVAVPLATVVATRPLARGAIIRETDLELRRDVPTDAEGPSFRRIADVVGREALRTISPGKAVTQDAIRSPLCVRRGEAVTVYAKTDGIQVRTTARAKDDGAMGDLIAVESLRDRKSFFARVCGAREVEVFARAAQVDREQAAEQPSPRDPATSAATTKQVRLTSAVTRNQRQP